MGGVPADLTATANFLDSSFFVAFAFTAALGHALGLVEGQAPTLAWMAARFNGVPTLGNCILP